MKFCAACGSSVERRVPAGDDRTRDVCVACGTVFYRNPKIVAGAIPLWGEQVLMCRRAIEPREGYWTLPAGFMELGESTAAAATRETLEEACAEIEIDALFAYIDIPRISQVYVIYRAHLAEPRFAPGRESHEVRLFDESAIPWREIAFPSIDLALRRFFADRAAGHYRLHTETIERSLGGAGKSA